MLAAVTRRETPETPSHTILRTMKPSMLSGTILAAAALAVPRAAARQDVALKDLMPKGMVIGVAVNQRQFAGADATAVDLTCSACF